ncbi:MAG: hypothetical protein CMH52_04625 [Myxococcales bacterium]|nr:hypothetical protein [Myxococcales bacterium]
MNEIGLEELSQAWLDAQSGSGRLIHIVSGVGTGKSNLLAHFVDDASAADGQAAIVSIRCGDRALVRPSDHGELEELVARLAEGVRVIEWGMNGADKDAAIPWLLPGIDFLHAATHVSALPSVPSQTPPPSRAEIHAGLLMDVARHHPILMVIDDIHRIDTASKALLDVLEKAFAIESDVKLLLVCASSTPLSNSKSNATSPTIPEASYTIAQLKDAALAEILTNGLSHRVKLSEAHEIELSDKINGNPLVAHALVDHLNRITILKRGRDGKTKGTAGLTGEAFDGLWSLAVGQLPKLRADVQADLQTAALVGQHFTTELMARIWSVPDAAAALRIELLTRTGLIRPEADGWAFLSEELAGQWTDLMDPNDRDELHVRIATILRLDARMTGPLGDGQVAGVDVTETWSESRYRDRTRRATTESLWATAGHFSAAGRHGDAAEAAVTYVESLFDLDGGPGLLYGQHGRQRDRERRHRIYAALTEADAQLNLAERFENTHTLNHSLADIRVRMLSVKSRFKAIMGDFAEARATADMALGLAVRMEQETVRLEALRVYLEVCYASGDTNAARAALVRILDALNLCSPALALPVYVWLSEAFAKWEWPGLHGRLFPFILDQAQAIGGVREGIQIRIEWLVALIQVGDQDAVDDMLKDAISVGEEHQQLGFLAELMVKRATEIIEVRVDSHYNILSGEFYVPDLFGEGFGPSIQPLNDVLSESMQLLELAQELASNMEDSLVQLRVATSSLAVVIETRERLTDLLERWMPIQIDQQPVRLTELAEFLAQGFFSVQHMEHLSERIIILADELNLHQILADTAHEALDRELPSAMARSGTLFTLAKESYEQVGDTYGLATLSLTEARYEARRGQDPMDFVEQGIGILKSSQDQWTVEQAAYLHLRFGEMLLEVDDRAGEAIEYLEGSMRLYERSGDMDHLHVVGAILHEVYRKQGDLGRYRAIRDRFRSLDQLSPGSDPLRLEMRIEHLLGMARQEANDERAIEMVEHCIHLFGRMPDGTTRIDECFVEISKICRRRADEAETENGFNAWLERSLESVRIAISINRGLNNYYRVFEELHELFDDLLGLSMFEEYLRVRAENREMAFAVGNIGELLYLFEEHLHYDADRETSAIRLPEVRSFYEALFRYLLGLGATADALSIQSAFVSFLIAIGEPDLATRYQDQKLRYDESPTQA